MRPITATIIKVNEEEETSSVSSYDVFQNLIIKKSNYEFDYGSTTSLSRNKNGLQFTLSNGSLGGRNFMNSGAISKGKNSFRDNNLMGNINTNNDKSVGSMKVSGMRINNMRNSKN